MTSFSSLVAAKSDIAAATSWKATGGATNSLERAGGPAADAPASRVQLAAIPVLASASSLVGGGAIGQRRRATGAPPLQHEPADKKVNRVAFFADLQADSLAPYDLEEGEIAQSAAFPSKELEEGEIDPDSLRPFSSLKATDHYLPVRSSQKIAPLPVTFEECKGINISIYRANSAVEIEQICQKKLDQFDAVNLSTALHRLAKLHISQVGPQSGKESEGFSIVEKRIVDKLAGRAIRSMTSFNPKELANTAWACATLGICELPLMRAVSRSAESRTRRFKPQELTNLVWAFAKLGIREDRLMSAIAQSAERGIGAFNPRDLSNTAWGFAKLGIREDRLMSAIARSSEAKIGEFNSQDLSNTAWAFATLGICDDALMRALARTVENRIGQLTSQHLSMTAWAFATLGICDYELMKKLARATERKIYQFNSESLCKTVWAFAKLGIRDCELMRALARATEGKIQELNSQTIASMAWAYAMLGIREDKLMSLLARSVKSRILEFNPQDLGNIAWAFATLDIRELALMKALVHSAESRILEFTPQNLCNIAWAFAKLGIRECALMGAVARSLESRIFEFNPQMLAVIAWSFASLAIRDDRVMGVIAGFAQTKLDEFTPQNLSNIAWAFALLEYENHPIFQGLARVLLKRSHTEFSTIQVYQLLQAQAALKLSGVCISLIPSDWDLTVPVHDSAVSNFQQNVGIYLKDWAQSRGKELKTEHFIPEINHHIDFTVGEIAFEVDGPFHFALESSELRFELLGPTLFRNRLLKLLGWKLVCIPHWEWYQLNTAEEKRRYIDQKIGVLK